ncbi:integrase [Kutzneria sp. NPDC052558]|uniref:integrase n=1 Tax=Kutzneria sp. NPDC052558 TaxID=3364121 RepID=UPI0037CC9770
MSGFTPCLADHYTGARWSELVGQQRHEYDPDATAITIRAPLKEVNGSVSKGGVVVSADVPPPSVSASRRSRGSRKGGRTKTPADTRVVDLPPFFATFSELLMNSHGHPFVFVSPDGAPLRRANFRQRYWRPAWDGVKPDRPEDPRHVPAILPWFTFHEGRHSHSTWLTEDGIAEVGRRARLGQKMKGIARVYDHVTPAMNARILDVLEARWSASLAALTASERLQLGEWFPHLRPALEAAAAEEAKKIFATFSPHGLGRARKTADEDRRPSLSPVYMSGGRYWD